MYRKIFTLKKHQLLALFLTTALLNACEQPKKQYDYSIFAFGTLIDIALYSVSQNQADDAFALLQKDFDRYHQQWSPWTDGDLALLNKQLSDAGSTKDNAITIPEHLIPIINTSMVLSELSNNYYNPAIGKLINLWQFHKYQDTDIQPPQNSLIKTLVKNNPQMSDLIIKKKNKLINTNPAVSLNFGAFAKGYAIALEIEQLKKLGIHNAVINAGGDLSVIGQHGNRAWNIGIRHPRNNKILASVEVKSNENVFTSGDYERVYFYQGQRYHHILDPKTGYPTQDAQSVTVIHSDAGLADAAATALFVAGSEHWQSIAKKMGIRYVMLIDTNGNIHMTPAMQSRIKFLNKSPTSHIFVSEDL
jgi:FAD:protein FMN transferase